MVVRFAGAAGSASGASPAPTAEPETVGCLCYQGSVQTVSVDKAHEYMLLNARLVDRLRFEFQFQEGDPGRVVAAVRAYQNPDGGFGNGLEPDLRGAGSQPVGVDLALFSLDEVRAVGGDMLAAALAYLESITRPDGGLPFVLTTVHGTPRAPWWQPEPDAASSLNPTGAILGVLHKNGVRHPWIDRATRYCWERIDALTATSPYEVRAVLAFLEHVPDRRRAAAAMKRFGRFILDGGHVALDPDAPGHVLFPLDFAPRPASIARSLFAPEVIDRHLDALAGRQNPDGGWGFTFDAWTPITRFEWGGWVTVESLLVLRDNGRL